MRVINKLAVSLKDNTKTENLEINEQLIKDYCELKISTIEFLKKIKKI